ncbi:DE-cadherin [Chelonus insularis]|uniref:DE-cadherin n=1 Tax=Chelonus insularis TaxID=460826 RepID=UPI001589F0CC|nr:DE-cadherin [Chelonus insularis]
MLYSRWLTIYPTKQRLNDFGFIVVGTLTLLVLLSNRTLGNEIQIRQLHLRHEDGTTYSKPFSFNNHVVMTNRYNDDNHNHKPVFSDCPKYAPTVKEDEPSGTIVITVRAEDRDPLDEGGTISYSFVTAPGEKLKFEINNVTGLIKTTQVLDRDEPAREKEAYLTVLATDNGRPQLDDVCTFKVTIEDVNDNSPVFDKVVYTESVPQDLPVKHEVMRVSATDIDDGNNSVVQYSLSSIRPEDANYFKIDEKTGVINLNQRIDREPEYKFRLIARAQDLGKPEPKASEIELEIRVIESNKKSPTFLPLKSFEPIEIKENFSDFDATIIRLEAISNIDDNPDLLFELVTGGTEQTNKGNTFRLESEKNTADIKLSQHLDYESITEYTLIVRVQNKYNLAAETIVNIRVLDVNDNIPVFREMKKGSVLENEPPGVPVMQVRAIDADGTLAHNQVTYELDNFKDLFTIDKYTGNITTLTIFDREAEDTYNVKVIAIDSSPSALFKTGEHNKGQQDFRIEIADKNDNPPHFNRSVYTANSILENANINALVTEVKAHDMDTASPVTYSIISGNTDDSFYIEGTTGKIRIKRPLDYEKITEYNLTVRAFDGVYDDNATVKIFIENVNDNPPVFEDFDKNPTIEEEKLINGCITTVEAYDPDVKDRSADQHIAYFIVKEDQQPLINIDKTGCITLKKPLDRDPPNGYPMWTVIVMARDDDGSPTALRELVMVNITLIDINDNAPFLDMIQPVVWQEGLRPGNITKLKARDWDSDENGPPFKFSIDENSADDIILSRFSIRGDDLRAEVTFDREEYKQYEIPILITDNGKNKVMTGTSTLTIIIGDINDNEMKDGSSSIFVYNYQGTAPDTEIGRVYVDDLDDWDLQDKHFSWLDNDNNDNIHNFTTVNNGVISYTRFSLNLDNGMITMLSGQWNDASYLLRFKVTEESKAIKRHSVNAYVNVTVKNIPEEAVMKSGSVRFHGISAEEFIAPNRKNASISKKDMFHERLSSILNLTIENIDVFTVLHSPHYNNKSLLDVRFSAHGSPYYAAERLNSIVAIYSKEIEHDLNVSISLINIDECVYERRFCNNSCRSYLNVTPKPYSVYTNITSFVGVRAVVDPQCTCHVAEPITCLNGGTPLITETGEGDRCECPPGLDGPRCELLDIGFQGDGWAILKSVNQACDDSHLGLELKSYLDNGLVFYIGPMSYGNNNESNFQDFMSLEIQHGYAVLYVDYGSGTVKLDQKQTKLNDGKEHRIDIYWTKTTIEMKVDNCGKSACMSLVGPIGPNEFLNVNSPLQIGGTMLKDFNDLYHYFSWNYKPINRGFVGCIRNLTINGNTYDFRTLALSKNAYPACSHSMSKAVSFGIDTNFLVAILVCVAILLILLLAVVVHRRKRDDLYKDMDDIRENIINYEDEGGGEVDTGYDLNVLRHIYDNTPTTGFDSKVGSSINPNNNSKISEEMAVPDICGFLDNKKQNCDKDPDTTPYDDVRHYAYEGEGNSDGSLSSLASCTDDGDLKFNYLSNFGPRFRKLADMYGEESSNDEDDDNNDSHDDDLRHHHYQSRDNNNDVQDDNNDKETENDGVDNNMSDGNINRHRRHRSYRHSQREDRESESWC